MRPHSHLDSVRKYQGICDNLLNASVPILLLFPSFRLEDSFLSIRLLFNRPQLEGVPYIPQICKSAEML